MATDVAELLEELRRRAADLNRIDTPSPTATPFYELMSGGIVWTDEKISGVRTEVIWALRPLFAYRASLIAGMPAEKWRSYWDACQTLFPHWIGFRPDRCQPAPELLVLLKKGEAAMLRDLEAGLEKSPNKSPDTTRGK